MQGFSVIFFSLWAMAANLGTTFRLTVLPWTVAAAVVFGLLELAMGAGNQTISVLTLGLAWTLPQLVPILVLSGFVVFMFGCWIGVSWHRHILLKEQAVSVLPRRNSHAVRDYFPSALKFAILVLAAKVAIDWVLNPLVPAMGLVGPGGKMLSILLNALLVSFVLRLGLVLPAAAVGKPITLEASWKATRDYWLPVCAVSLFIVQFIELTRLLQCRSAAECLLYFIGNWIGLVLTLGALSVLYGVRFQGRKLIV